MKKKLLCLAMIVFVVGVLITGCSSNDDGKEEFELPPFPSDSLNPDEGGNLDEQELPEENEIDVGE